LPLCTILTEELGQEKKFEKWRERGERGTGEGGTGEGEERDWRTGDNEVWVETREER
jgi:hypothetical protein